MTPDQLYWQVREAIGETASDTSVDEDELRILADRNVVRFLSDVEWPFQTSDITADVTAGVAAVTLPSTVRTIEDVWIDDSGGQRTVQEIAHWQYRNVASLSATTGGATSYVQQPDGSLLLHPTPASDGTLNLRVTTDIDNVTDFVAACPAVYHGAVVHLTAAHYLRDRATKIAMSQTGTPESADVAFQQAAWNEQRAAELSDQMRRRYFARHSNEPVQFGETRNIRSRRSRFR